MSRRSTDDRFLLNRVILGWATPIAWRGLFRPLTEEELPPGPRCFSAENIRDLAEAAWQKEKAAREADKQPINLWKGVCVPLSRFSFYEGGALEILSGVLAGAGRPLCLQHALRALDPSQGYSLEAGIGLAVGLVVISWVENWARYHGMFLFMDIGFTRCAMGLVQLATMKTISLRPGEASAGQESTIIGTDIMGMLPMVGIVPLGICAAATLPAGIIMLLVFLGPASLVGVALMFFAFFLTALLQPTVKKAAINRLKQTDERVRAMREVIDTSEGGWVEGRGCKR